MNTAGHKKNFKLKVQYLRIGHLLNSKWGTTEQLLTHANCSGY